MKTVGSTSAYNLLIYEFIYLFIYFGILQEKKDSNSEILEESKSPNDPFKAELKKMHELKMKSLDDNIEATSNVG
jgi:hypothetical protein